MKRLTALLLAIALLLAGCSGWMDGEYHNVRLHTEESGAPTVDFLQAENYADLLRALTEMVEGDLETGTISVDGYPQEKLPSDMDTAIRALRNSTPLGAYTVDSVTYEQGISGGLPAVVVTIHYNGNRLSIRRMRRVETMQQVQNLIQSALNQVDDRLVVQVDQFSNVDFAQFVRDYGEAHPEIIMEAPEVTVNAYPTQGATRILEVRFVYQNSREDLKNMQSRVQPLFASARLYISGGSSLWERFSLLYFFLMARDNYQMDTSLTPAYSLLIHGVGDSRAFALVYAAMCHQSGLTCYTVAGTKDGESRFWNIVGDGESYRHLDLLSCWNAGSFRLLTDQEMTGYVWDYSAYPVCEPEETEPTQAESESTEPTDTTVPPQETAGESFAPPPATDAPLTPPPTTSAPTEPTEPPTDPPGTSQPEEPSEPPPESTGEGEDSASQPPEGA